MPRPLPPDRMLEEVRRHRARHERFLRERPRTMAQNLALAGALGWTIVLPSLLGVLCGRWLDRRLGAGVFWSATCLLLGLGAGSWLAWRRVRSE
jgi:ATP synthase protein I